MSQQGGATVVRPSFPVVPLGHQPSGTRKVHGRAMAPRALRAQRSFLARAPGELPLESAFAPLSKLSLIAAIGLECNWSPFIS